MKLGNLGKQIVIKSKKTFGLLLFENAERVDGNIYFKKRMERDDKARKDYLKKERLDKIDSGELFLVEILKHLPFSKILELYHPLHEADITKFFEVAKQHFTTKA